MHDIDREVIFIRRLRIDYFEMQAVGSFLGIDEDIVAGIRHHT